MFGGVLWHAASAAYFVTGGIALWFADRCIRALRRSQTWEASICTSVFLCLSFLSAFSRCAARRRGEAASAAWFCLGPVPAGWCPRWATAGC